MDESHHAEWPTPKQRMRRAADRLDALRLHAIAIGALVDDVDVSDFASHVLRAGDVAEVITGADAGVLVRVMRVYEADVRGFRLRRGRARDPHAVYDRWLPGELRRVGCTEYKGLYPLSCPAIIPADVHADLLAGREAERAEQKRVRSERAKRAWRKRRDRERIRGPIEILLG